MSNAAILIGNIEYRNLARLACCRDDILAVRQLLDATEKYEAITVIEDVDADALKSRIREAIDKVSTPDELFFYFSGHGHQQEAEFFYCATNFDPKRPNETGVSTTELHTLLKLANAGLVVKVVDACNSGTLLVKSDGGLIPQSKEGFRNLIQIASCLDSQNSLTGDPISIFTEKFRAAALRKTDGVIYYTDIINTLRDEFLDNNSQTPFFVSQYTGREQFVSDAKRLDSLRALLSDNAKAEPGPSVELIAPRPLTLVERLRNAEAKVVTDAVLKEFIDEFFDNLLKAISTSEFVDFFQLEVSEHGDFEEPTAEKQIIRVLTKEKRPDNFVTATYSRKIRGQSPLLANATFLSGLFGPHDFDEEWGLSLNCRMSRAQLRITLTPKFANLKRIVLVVSCAPSLDHCYVFEIATEHLLRDFGKFESDGFENSRRWWKVTWSERTDGIRTQISEKLAEIVRAQLESAEARLSKEG